MASSIRSPRRKQARLRSSRLGKVSTNLAALKASAKSQSSSQITELDADLDGFKATVTGINGDSLPRGPADDRQRPEADRRRLDDVAAADRPGLRVGERGDCSSSIHPERCHPLA